MAVTPSPAISPWSLSRAEWIDIVKRAWTASGKNNTGLLAAGVTFYAFLAMVPLIASVVLVYSLVSSPESVVHDVKALTTSLPKQAAQIIGDQLTNAVRGSGGKKGFGLALSLGLALFSARSGARAVLTALNIAFGVEEKRGFIALTLLTLGMVAASALMAVVAASAIAALGFLTALIPQAPGWLISLGKLVPYLIFVLVAAAGAASLYRWGPSGGERRWVWLSPGSLLTAVALLAMTLGFGVYVANFGNYNATYGALGAVVVLLTWIDLSAYVLLLGAELNAEFERAAARRATASSAEREAAPPPATPRVPMMRPQPAGTHRGVDAGAWAVALVATRRAGMIGSALGLSGLALLRGRRPLAGFGLLAGGAGLSLLAPRRKKPGRSPRTA